MIHLTTGKVAPRNLATRGNSSTGIRITAAKWSQGCEPTAKAIGKRSLLDTSLVNRFQV